MARNDPQFNVRMPQELKHALEVASKQSGRSMNSEIIFRLQQSLAKDIDDVGDIELKQVNDYRFTDESFKRYMASLNERLSGIEEALKRK